MIKEVAFKDFAALAAKREWSPEFLAERFKAKIEGPSEFFHRLFQPRYGDVVIPYRSVLSFYFQELRFHQEQTGNRRVCACGCGLPVFDRKKWASPGCKKRIGRKRSHGQAKGANVSA